MAEHFLLPFAATTSGDAMLNQYCLEYSYAELCQTTSNFDPTNQLGTGSYGAVFRGVRRDGTEIAVKVLDLPDEAGFEEEVRVLSKFRHPNLVILMGFARRDATRFLVYELLAGGDAYQRLQRSTRNEQSFTWNQRSSVVFDAACGLSHLHHATPKVFHRDIKSPNILLDRNGTAKMADFGLACLSHSMSQRVEKAAGTTGYACPLYTQRAVVTEGSEVYSFGMVMLEMLTATSPAVLLKMSDGTQHYRFLVCEIHGSAEVAVSMADTKAQWPAEASLALARLALRCAQEQEELRPNFAEIVNNLRQLRDYVPREAEPPVAHALPPAFVRMPVVQTVPLQPAMMLAQPAMMLQQQQQQQQVAKVMPLWSLRCVLAEEKSFSTQDALAIIQWHEIGSSLSTTLRVGRLFQEEFFNKVAPGSSSLVSREHFQIWAEPLNMPGVLEPSTACIPCAFFLTNFSSNGTIVNDVHLTGSRFQMPIHSGDSIAIPRLAIEGDCAQPKPLIQFMFDLSGSILQDANFSADASIVGGA